MLLASTRPVAVPTVCAGMRILSPRHRDRRPQNADLAGLPKSYIIQQLADYKSGARGTTLPARTPPKLMIELSKPMTVGEIEAAATYFSALQPRKRIKVVESDTAPKTNVAGLLWAAVETGEREPIGARIVEVPDDVFALKAVTLDRPSQRMCQSGASPEARRLSWAGRGKRSNARCAMALT